MGKGRPVPAMSEAGPPLPGQLPFGASSRSLGPPLLAPSGDSGSYFSGAGEPLATPLLPFGLRFGLWSRPTVAQSSCHPAVNRQWHDLTK